MRKIIALLVLLVSLLPLTARDIYSLNDGWQFFFKHENESENARIVTLPHSWNTDPQAGAQFNETTANYLRDVFLPEEWSSKRLFVKFYGAQSVANFFVNGRHVQSRTMSAALEEAYRNRIMVGRFPSCVLHLRLPEHLVDVNDF